MPDGADALSVEVLGAIGDVPAADWEACAGAANPFVGHAFLAALEQSGTVAPEAGWLPRHLGVFGPDRRLLACMPLYLKSHSYGEYVFDWGWATRRAGGRALLPKASGDRRARATPATGTRIPLRAKDAPAGTPPDALLAAVRRPGGRRGSGLLVDPPGCSAPRPNSTSPSPARGLLFPPRTTLQFHWKNRGLQPRSTTSSASSQEPQAQAAAQGAPGRSRARGSSLKTLTGRRDRGAALGRLLPLLSRHHQPQVGARLPEPRLLLPPGRDHGRPGDAGDGGDARRRAGRRRPQPVGRRTRSTGATGAAPTPAGSCTSRPATTGRSTSPSSIGWPASRRARRASTRSSEATCRSRPGARTGSATPGLRRAVQQFLAAERPADRSGNAPTGGRGTLPPGPRT